jgi:uncharacterized protein YgiM (DUF1202 family)
MPATEWLLLRFCERVDRQLPGYVMPPLLSVLGFLSWPAAIGAALLVLGASSETTLSLVHQGLSTGSGSPSVIKASIPTPVIRMPSTPVVSADAARAKITLLNAGRQYVAANAILKSVAPDAGPAQMTATTGLIVRSKPMKASAAMGSIAKGARVEVQSKQGGWLLVESAEGVTGWVFGKYLATTPEGASTQTSPQKIAETTTR